jgi:sugar/nucleoside kinase (ribokinase family)
MFSKRPPKGLFVGLAAVDILYTVDKLPRCDEKLSVAGQRLSAGGPATNAAVTFAGLGGRVQLVSAGGAHPLASIIREDLSAHKVRLHDVVRNQRVAPPVSSIMVERHSGQRAVVSANAAVFGDINPSFEPRWLAGASVLLVDGHYMRLCIAAARHARKQGVRVVLDSGSWKPGMEALLSFVDTAICSETFRPPDCRNAREVFEYLADVGIARVAITAGASPIRVVQDGKRTTIAVERVRAVDTLGAGDILHGAFCFYIAQPSATFTEALTKAARVASFSCRFSGTRSWMARFRA